MTEDFKKLCEATVPFPKKAVARHKEASTAAFEEGFNDGMIEPEIEEESDEATHNISATKIAADIVIGPSGICYILLRI